MENRTEIIIKDSVRRLYCALQQKKKTDKYVDDVKKKEQVMISNYMYSYLPKGTDTFEIVLDDGEDFYANHVKLKVTRVRRKSIKWNIEKLKSKLDKSMFKKVTDKTYTINDIYGLVEYLKRCGVSPKKFKTFLDVTETINDGKLNYYYETGEIKKSDVEGCYEIKFGEPYIKMIEQK